MRYPWSTNRNDTRVYRPDPCVPLGRPSDPFEAIDKLYQLRVAENERRRLEAACDNLIFLKPQAE